MKTSFWFFISCLWFLGCSSSEDYNKTKELCESTNRSFPGNQINADGEGLTDMGGSIISPRAARYLVATNRLGFVEQAIESSGYWSFLLQKDNEKIENKFARIEIVESDPVSCSKKEYGSILYSMYANGMTPDQCLQVTLQEGHSGRYILKKEGKKEGSWVALEYILSDRESAHSSMKTVSSWSDWPSSQYPIFQPSKTASCIANTDSVKDVFIASSHDATRADVPPVMKVEVTSLMGHLRFKAADIEYKEFNRLESEYDPRDIVVASDGYRTLVLDGTHFLAHLDFKEALTGSCPPRVLALNTGVLVLDVQHDGLAVYFIDPEKPVLRGFSAIVGEGSPLSVHCGPGGVDAFVRGNRLVVEGSVKGIPGGFFEADLSGLQPMLKN